MRYSTALFIALAAVLGGAMAILPPIPPTAEEAATITRSHPTPTPIRSPSVGPISLGFHYRARKREAPSNEEISRLSQEHYTRPYDSPNQPAHTTAAKSSTTVKSSNASTATNTIHPVHTMGASSRSLRPRTTRNNSDRGVEREASPEERVDQHPKQFTRTTAHHSSTATGKSLSQYTSNKANNPVANSQLRSTLTTHHVYTPAVSSHAT